jgi:hypothetical protein
MGIPNFPRLDRFSIETHGDLGSPIPRPQKMKNKKIAEHKHVEKDSKYRIMYKMGPVICVGLAP